MLTYDGDWVVGDADRIWLRDGSKRYRLKVSRQLTQELCPEDPESYKTIYHDRLLAAAQWKLDNIAIESGDGITWIELSTRDVELVQWGR